MRLVMLALVALQMACAQGYIRPRPRAADADANTMRVETVVFNPPREWFQRSGWYRRERDLATPLRVYISGTWACVLELPELEEPQAGEYVTCPTKWRRQSNVDR